MAKFKMPVGCIGKEGEIGQLDNHLQIFWAFEEIREDSYMAAHKAINQSIGIIKNLRTARNYYYQKIDGQVIIGERGRKCSVDGEVP